MSNIVAARTTLIAGYAACFSSLSTLRIPLPNCGSHRASCKLARSRNFGLLRRCENAAAENGNSILLDIGKYRTEGKLIFQKSCREACTGVGHPKETEDSDETQHRPCLERKSVALLYGEVASEVLNGKQVDVGDWKELRTLSVRKVATRFPGYNEKAVDRTFDVQFLTYCVQTENYSWGLSFIEYLSCADINPAVLKVIAEFCCLFYDKLEGSGILPKIVDAVHKKRGTMFEIAFPNMMLPILALTMDSTALIDHVKKIQSQEEKINRSAAICLISVALKKNDWKTVDWLLEHVDSSGRICIGDVMNSFIYFCRLQSSVKGQSSVESLKSKMERFMQVFSDHESYLSLAQAKEFGQFIQTTFRFAVNPVIVDHRRICQHCSSTLPRLGLSQCDYDLLNREIVENVLLKNVMAVSDPQELDKFKRIMISKGPFDAVVDGLNIGLQYLPKAKQGGENMNYRILKMVTLLRSLGKENIAVVNRKHGSRMNAMVQRQLESCATLFYVDNKSHDDIFTILAAIQSGPGCHFVSLDNFGFAKKLLSSPTARNLFEHWVYCSQIKPGLFTKDGYTITWPSSLSIRPHLESNRWHIPYWTGELYKSVPKDKIFRWLCVQTNPTICANDENDLKQLEDSDFANFSNSHSTEDFIFSPKN